MNKPLTNRRILRALEAVRDSMPAWDSAALDYCKRRNLVETIEHEGMPADVFTVTGANLLNATELYFGQTLKAFHESGQLRRPEDHGKEEEHDNTDQQARRSAARKARKEKQVKDHGARYGRR